MSRGMSISLLYCCLASSGLAAAGGTIPDLGTVLVVDGLTRPLWVGQAPGDNDRLFIIEQFDNQQGRIRIFKQSTSTLLTTPFLTVAVSDGNEQGMLGLAFHPQYATNGKFYVHYVAPGGATIVAQYTVSSNADLADAASANVIFTVAQPFANHNGGWMAFGADGYLYLALGDGGSGNDPGNRAQNISSSLLGKILRLDINADDFPSDPNRDYRIPADNPFAGATAGLDEIWHYGLRNPYRCSFDRLTGDLYIGDVGQNDWEEVSFWKSATAAGRNYGWRCMEGDHCTGLSGCACEIGCAGGPLTCPIYDYSHLVDGFSCSITGGYVYRGSAICALRGHYFFTDYCSSRIKTFTYNRDTGARGSIIDRTNDLAPGGSLEITGITSFGEDNDGELYLVDQGGEIYKIITSASGAACTSQILFGDMNCDAAIDVRDIGGFVLAATDLTEYAARFPSCDPVAGDFSQDGIVSTIDIAPFVAVLLGL